MHYEVGSFVSRFEARSLQGTDVKVPSTQSKYVHLMFRRYAGCPICNLHLRALVRDRHYITNLGVRQIVVVASPKEAVGEHMGELPFEFIADPERKLYEKFSVETSPTAWMHPSAMRQAVQGIIAKPGIPSMSPSEGATILPAEFIIGPSGKILAAKYGKHAGDQWNVDEIVRQLTEPAR